MGSIDLSWSVQKERDSFIDLYGERGTIRVGWKGSWYKTQSSKEWTRYGEGYDKVVAFRDNVALGLPVKVTFHLSPFPFTSNFRYLWGY